MASKLTLRYEFKNDPTDDVEIHGPSTPAHAQFRSRLDFGSLWTFGLRGTF